jgi:exonuclease SbcD
MTHQFAHIADVHLGANRHGKMAELEIGAFARAMDICIARHVDFIIIAGDLFHIGVPSDLNTVRQAVVKMREVAERGIPIYAIYGSHDYTPTSTSIIDVIESAGLLTKIVKPNVVDDTLKLECVEDERTGAKLVGISARRMGLEREYYDMLDRDDLERLDGFKIFAFHCGIDELKPEYLSRMDSIPISLFPKGFDYYAGGHVHQHSEHDLPGYDRIVFPGPLFAGYGRDFEFTAKGERRGFYIVSFDQTVTDVEFVETGLVESMYKEYDLTGLNSSQGQEVLAESFGNLDVDGKIVVLKVRGELYGGKTSDIDFAHLQNLLYERGAIDVHLGRRGLASADYAAIKVSGDDVTVIEERIFKENIGTVRTDIPELQGDSGVKLSLELLRVLKEDRSPAENKKDYEARMLKDALGVLQLKGVFEK